MQTITHWPDLTKLALPEPVAQNLYQQLLEPFDTELAAKEFWEEASSTIIILNHFDSIKHLEQGAVWKQIDFALTYPEYTVPLKMDYQLMVAIVNDSGSGVYLVIPPELSTLISEKQNELNNNV